jgi:methyl-accepting chemotaxis protein
VALSDRVADTNKTERPEMGVMTWLRQQGSERSDTAQVARLAHRASTRSRQAVAAAEDVDGLDFASAIRSHQVWKKQLAEVVAGEDHAGFDLVTVRRDDCCELGRWMRGRGSYQYRGRAVFRELFGTHAAFHQSAAEVLMLHGEGDDRQARALMDRGLFALNSVRVQGLLAQLFFEAEDSAARLLLASKVVPS